MTTNRFSGLVFVTSSYDAMAMYRVDGVSGLNVLTGIKSKVFPTHSLEWRGHQSCSQSGNQLSVPPIIRLSAALWGKRSGETSKDRSLRNKFFLRKFFHFSKNPQRALRPGLDSGLAALAATKIPRHGTPFNFKNRLSGASCPQNGASQASMRAVIQRVCSASVRI